MYDGLRSGNFTSSAAFAVMILVLVLPVMWVNVRRTPPRGAERDRPAGAARRGGHARTRGRPARTERSRRFRPSCSGRWSSCGPSRPSGFSSTRSAPGATSSRRDGGRRFSTPIVTLGNYQRALFDPPGGSLPFWKALLNSFAIAIPGTVVPIAIAAAAAYAFAWMDFQGRHWLFIAVLAMMAVPVADVAGAPPTALLGRRPPHRGRHDLSFCSPTST